MTLPHYPPQYARWADLVAPIRRGEAGWRAWALQIALDAEPNLSVDADGDFGPATEKAVKTFQRNYFLTADGIAGPVTQQKLLSNAEVRVHKELPDLPVGVLLGFSIVEGASVLAATNWFTPPGGRQGVDCGPVQWRQYGPPFDLSGLMGAFNARTAFQYAGEALLERMAAYGRRRPSLSKELRLRLALLAHNWPAGAEQVVKNGHLTSPNSPAGWTTKPGGGHYTQGEWLQEYPDRILAYVH